MAAARKKKEVQQTDDAFRKTKERQNKSFLSWIYLSLALAVIIGIGIILYFKPWEFFQQKDEGLSLYNNYEFERGEDGLWNVRIAVDDRPYAVVLHYHPTQLESIPVEQEAVNLIYNVSTSAIKGQGGELFIAMDPEAPGALVIAGVELAKVFGEKYNIFGIPTKAAFSRPLASGSTLSPVKTCADADEDTVVVLIRVADEDRVGVPTGYDRCVVVQATDANQTIAVADRFVYALFNVIPAG